MPWADGESFAGVLFGQSGGRQFMIEDQPVARYSGGWFHGRWRAVRTPKSHYIRTQHGNYLFDLEEDPWELDNVLRDHPWVRSRLRHLLRAGLP